MYRSRHFNRILVEIETCVEITIHGTLNGESAQKKEYADDLQPLSAVRSFAEEPWDEEMPEVEARSALFLPESHTYGCGWRRLS